MPNPQRSVDVSSSYQIKGCHVIVIGRVVLPTGRRVEDTDTEGHREVTPAVFQGTHHGVIIYCQAKDVSLRLGGGGGGGGGRGGRNNHTVCVLI